MSAERIDATVAAFLTSVREAGEFVTGDWRVTEEVAARLLGVVPGTLRNWRAQDKGPDFYRAGRITYPLRALAEWLEKRRVNTEIAASDVIARHAMPLHDIDG